MKIQIQYPGRIVNMDPANVTIDILAHYKIIGYMRERFGATWADPDELKIAEILDKLIHAGD